MTWVQNLAGAALAVLAAGSTAMAQVRAGSVVNFAGLARAQDVGTRGVQLTFLNEGAVLADATGNTRSFAGLNADASGPRAGTIANFRVGTGDQAIGELLTIGGYTFSLAALPSGPFPQTDCYNPDPAVGQLCTPYQGEIGKPRPGVDVLSPFYMANVPSDVLPPEVRQGTVASLVAFNLVGTVAGARGPASAFFGTIYSVFPLSFQQVLAGLEAYGEANLPLKEEIPFFGTFVVGGRANTLSGFAELDPADVGVTVTPEPSTVVLLGAGLAGLATMAGAARRRR
jgi:hypothetical protein